MSGLTFRGNLDGTVLLGALDAIAGLVASPEVAGAWDDGSALRGMTVGGLTRHLVSQAETALEFLPLEVPAHADHVSLAECYARSDWLMAPVDAPENTSIRDDFVAMAAGGQRHSVAILADARRRLPAVLSAAGPTTYVPWQDCVLATEDFLACRLLEIVVHADDLAASVGVPTPGFDDAAADPVLATLAVVAGHRHGAPEVLRALARTERATGSVSAFG
ncbi:maleylpyruvate isomerase N-terminal domain-containing protein [Cellulomonas sp. HZM]|uniref:maleylpyruvate isomerase N-terminal domain-containing protein n=1 Tax=Cellulomonas sp. HZM TaxID=1454010 RepID=UPI0004939CC9|nr:maleylpyruvate isomerase N-terminal domain-containing protein [Cellulomonas sp. HZM]